MCCHLHAQDSTITFEKKVVTLKEVVVHSNLNVQAFIKRVQQDTTFYKAFLNLKVLSYTALNDVRMRDKDGGTQAMLQSRTRQTVKGGCRSMETIEEKTQGDIRDKNGDWNYYTMQMYAGIMFVNGTKCGETNSVAAEAINVQDKSGLDKHKEQLKTLIFNPGRKIQGVPFIGNKVAIFDDNMAPLYDYEIDMEPKQGHDCYVFRIKAHEDASSSTVINNLTTWFDSNTMEIVARSYDLSYNTGVYDFNVQMEVQLGHFGEYLVPRLIRYTGEWHVTFKKRERGVFTATLFDFSK